MISGHDPKDSTSIDASVPDYLGDLSNVQHPLRIGLPREYGGEGVSQDVRQAVNTAVLALEKLGHEVFEISLPHTEYAIPAYYLIACAEASSNLARYDGCLYGHRAADSRDLMEMISQSRGEGFGDEVKRRIMLGTFALSSGYYDAYYNRAMKARKLIKDDFVSAFRTCDVIMHPVAPTVAFGIGEKLDDPLSMYLVDVFSVPANLAGLPAMSVPIPSAGVDLPIGIQLTGNYNQEGLLLSLADQIAGRAQAG